MISVRIRRLVAFLSLAFVLAMIAPLGAGAGPVLEGDPGNRTDTSNVGLAHDLIDTVFNEGDAEAAAALVDDDATIYTPFGTYQGPQGLLDYVAFVKRTYPDATFTLTSVASTEVLLHVEWHMTASQIQIDPVEEPQSIDVERSGSIEIAVNNGQIETASFDNGDLVFSDTQAVAADPRRGQPF